jgi:hypothetical protein
MGTARLWYNILYVNGKEKREKGHGFLVAIHAFDMH